MIQKKHQKYKKTQFINPIDNKKLISLFATTLNLYRRSDRLATNSRLFDYQMRLLLYIQTHGPQTYSSIDHRYIRSIYYSLADV